MNTTTTPTAVQGDWTAFVPTLPEVPVDQRVQLFENAPQDTVVEVDDELYRFSATGLWVALGEVVLDNFCGSSYASQETYEPSYLTALAASPTVVVRVLRLGAPDLYSAHQQ